MNSNLKDDRVNGWKIGHTCVFVLNIADKAPPMTSIGRYLRVASCFIRLMLENRRVSASQVQQKVQSGLKSSEKLLFYR